MIQSYIHIEITFADKGGKDLIARRAITAFALFFHFNGKRLVRVLTALLNGLQQSHVFQRRKNVGYRLTDQVFCTTAKMGEKRFVAKYQLPVRIDKGTKRVLGKTHRCWMVEFCSEY